MGFCLGRNATNCERQSFCYGCKVGLVRYAGGTNKAAGAGSLYCALFGLSFLRTAAARLLPVPSASCLQAFWRAH